MNKQEITVSELLPKIFNQINNAVRSAVKEAFENFTNNKPQNEEAFNVEHLSSPQAAEYLKIKLSTLYAKVKHGDLPYSRSGERKLLFLKTDLQQYVASRKVKSKQTK